MRRILRVEVGLEHDVVLARQRAREIADLLGFTDQDQTRIATAVSEIARNMFQYAHSGTVDFSLESGEGGASGRTLLCVRCEDKGPGVAQLKEVLEGRYQSRTGMGLGILGAKRLMDGFHIESSPQGTAVVLQKELPLQSAPITAARLNELVNNLASRPPRNPFEEMQRQNQELLRTIEDLRARELELNQVNAELSATNRGVVALYAEIDERADSFKRANERKSLYLSSMSHELRTPLNSILSLSGILLERMDGELTAEQEKQVSLMQAAARSLSAIVNDVLDLAKADSGTVTVRPSEFLVTSLFGTLKSLMKPLLVNPAVKLEFEQLPGVQPLYTDEGKVSQILRNFISNGLKFTESGEVRVIAEPGPGDTVLFTVSDTGIGIPTEQLQKVFEEFYQVDHPLQILTKGTGLGLPISKKLAEILGGMVSVRSKVGSGTSFCVILPRLFSSEAPADAAPISLTQVNQEAALPSLLIIDDDPGYRYLISHHLGSKWAIREAADGKEGLRLANQGGIAAIFLDLNLPGLNGFEVLTALKANPATKQVPVIIVSSQDLSEKDRQRLSRATSVLPKWLGTSTNEAETLWKALAEAGL